MNIGRYSFYLALCGECKSKFKFRLIRHNGLPAQNGDWREDIHAVATLYCPICKAEIAEHRIHKEED